MVGKIVGARQGQLGSFIHSTFHGNLGYIGLAVSYYALGNQGLIRASIIAGFMMIMQNLLGVIALQFYSDNSFVNQKKLTVILKILGNPVIVSAMAGILFSFIEDPDVIRKILKHLDLWEIKSRPPPKANAPPAETFIISDDQQMPSADDYLIDPAYPVEAYL